MSTANTNKPNVLTKTVAFGDRELHLYSLDGVTWSSRLDELEHIQGRHDDERARIGDFRGRFARKPAPQKAGAGGGPAPGQPATGPSVGGPSVAGPSVGGPSVAGSSPKGLTANGPTVIGSKGAAPPTTPPMAPPKSKPGREDANKIGARKGAGVAKPSPASLASHVRSGKSAAPSASKAKADSPPVRLKQAKVEGGNKGGQPAATDKKKPASANVADRKTAHTASSKPTAAANRIPKPKKPVPAVRGKPAPKGTPKKGQ